MLTQDQKNDLRKRVLQGQPLSLEEAKEVFESLRQGQAQAVLAGAEKKTSKKSGGKKGMSDEELDKDLDDLMKDM
jgi:hypothetical protein